MKLDEPTLTALRDAGRELAKSATAVLVGLSSDATDDAYRDRIAKSARRIAELAGLVPTDVADKFDVDTQDLDPDPDPEDKS